MESRINVFKLIWRSAHKKIEKKSDSQNVEDQNIKIILINKCSVEAYKLLERLVN